MNLAHLAPSVIDTPVCAACAAGTSVPRCVFHPAESPIYGHASSACEACHAYWPSAVHPQAFTQPALPRCVLDPSPSPMDAPSCSACGVSAVLRYVFYPAKSPMHGHAPPALYPDQSQIYAHAAPAVGGDRPAACAGVRSGQDPLDTCQCPR